MGNFLGSLFGGGAADSAAAGQSYQQAQNAYNTENSTVNPFLTTQMQQGFTPATYSAAQNRTTDAGLSQIATMKKQLGPGLPNIAGQTGDSFNSMIMGDASTSAQLAGENQQYQDAAAGQLAGNYNSEGQGYTQIGQNYQQAAQAAPNPFSSLFNIASMFFPGLGAAGGLGSILGGLFGGGGGSGSGNIIGNGSPTGDGGDPTGDYPGAVT